MRHMFCSLASSCAQVTLFPLSLIDVGKGDTLTLDEKWFTLDAEGKEVIEKYINSLR